MPINLEQTNSEGTATSQKSPLGFLYGIGTWSSIILFPVATAVCLWREFTRITETVFSQDPSGGQFHYPVQQPGLLLATISVLIIVLSLVLGLISLVGISHRVWRSTNKSFSPIQKAKDFLLSTYDRSEFDALLIYQTFLRYTFIITINLGALQSLLQSHGKEISHSDPVILLIHAGQIAFSLAYLVWTAKIDYRDTKSPPHSRSTKQFGLHRIAEAFSALLWWRARIDAVFISIIWISTLLPGRPYHLAYIIPITATWLFTEGNARKLMVVLLSALLAKSTIIGVMFMLDLPLLKKLDLSTNGYLFSLLQTITAFIFWATLGTLLTILRHLRLGVSSKAEEVARSNQSLQEATVELESANQRLKDALQAAQTAAEREGEALRKEQFLRRALETLGTQQGHAIFAKDTEARFIFANEILLKQFSSVPSIKALAPNEGPVPWTCIEGKTNRDLGIQQIEYETSDDSILTGKANHYSGFEPSFDPNAPPGSVIWTRKEPIRLGEKISGLVGCVVDGLPLTIQQFVNYVFGTLPVYAAIKDLQGHVKWANDLHLSMLEPKIDELLRKEGREEFIKSPLPARLRQLNKGNGPTDIDLYGDAGELYWRKDQEIISAGNSISNALGKKYSTINEIIAAWFSPETAKHKNSPNWIEYHRFPNGMTRWVEVWKMPLWEESAVNHTWKVRGVVVIFRDRNKDFTQRSVVWNWIDRDLSIVLRHGMKQLLRDLEDGKSNAEELRFLAENRFPQIHIRMLAWFRAFVENKAASLQLPQEPRTSNDLAFILRGLQHQCPESVQIAFTAPTYPIHLRVHGDDFFSAITAVVMNCIEATDSTKLHHRQPIRVSIKSEFDHLRARIESHTHFFHEIPEGTIYEHDAIDGSELSRGRSFLAQELSRHLARLSEGRDNTEAFLYERKGNLMVVDISIPLQVFAQS